MASSYEYLKEIYEQIRIPPETYTHFIIVTKKSHNISHIDNSLGRFLQGKTTS